jgi:hypothetical protein
MSTSLITFDVPNDKELLAALGELSLRHEHLNYMLRMTIRTFTQQEVEQVLLETKNKGSIYLRKRIEELAVLKLGEGEVLCQLRQLLDRCRLETEKRNALLHSIWGKELDGDSLRRDGAEEWQALPTVQELKKMIGDLVVLREDLIHARFSGFLTEALIRRKKEAGTNNESG